MFKELFIKNIGKIKDMKHISKENICAAPLKPPNKAYLELLAQPAKIKPNTLKEEIAR